MMFMTFRAALVLCLILLVSPAPAQEKTPSLEEIWNGTFSTSQLEALHSLRNGKEYSVLQTNPQTRQSTLTVYSYEDMGHGRVIAESGPGSPIPFFTSYSFSEDESLILLGTEMEGIFRRSKQGVYYVLERNSGDLIQVADKKIREPEISPGGKFVSYVLDNNLYLLDLRSGSTAQITTDGRINEVINGVADWVYEEEFSLVKAYEWNTAGDKLAFLRFDESGVPEFSMDVYANGLYPFPYSFKYPKAGEANAGVSLHLYDVGTDETRSIALPVDYYIPRLQWIGETGDLGVISMNRHQNKLQLYRVGTSDNQARLLWEEQDAAYVDITRHFHLEFLADGAFLMTSEADGFNHIYLHGPDGTRKTQLTSGPWVVTEVYGYDPKSRLVYYQSTENGSVNRDLYSVRSNGKGKKRLSTGEGTHSADFSANYSYYIETFSNKTTPPVYTLYQAPAGNPIRKLKDNTPLLEKLKNYRISPKEFGTLTVNGNDLNMWMVRPPDFDPGKQYPLLLFQYSGPGSQEVSNTWMDTNDYWHQYLAAEGYIIACVDGRGTGYRGREFEKVTYRQLGKYEVEDQIAVAAELSKRPYIDPGRTGIWGWSYGGFMATNCLLKGNETFELGIAVAPVTSWRFYDTIYTERYMRTPAENAGGYDDNSPLSYPELLRGEYLLIHGSGDDNVHVQNTMRMIEALVQANKQFDWAIYPDKAHSISGGNTRLHLYTMMTDFLIENL